MAAALLMSGSLMAQEPQVLINDTFEEYTVGNKLASEAVAAGHDWWTTWTNTPGSSEDGVIAEYEGTKCGYLTYGVDQVLMLGDEQSGIYDLEFDILVPNGKNAYFNILHHFTGTGSGNEWALECYLHMTGSGTHAPGQGTINAGGSNAASFTPVYDSWMHFRLHVDTDNDIAEYYLTKEGEAEQLVHSWTWSLNASNASTALYGRKLAAMDFYPPQNAANSEYYLDNFSYTKLSGESIAHLTFDPEALEVWIAEDDMNAADINISNAEGTTIGDWTGWIDFGASETTTGTSQINYDLDFDDSGNNLSGVSLNITTPTVVEVGAMFPGSAYAGTAMGTKLVSAQYPIFEWVDSQTQESIGTGLEPNTPLTFRVYRQGMNGQPGEVLAEKVIPADQIVVNDWNVATFDEPIILRGFDVWITCEFTQQVDGGAPFAFDGGSAAQYGDYFRTGGGGAFAKCSETFSQSYGNFHIRANCQGAPVSGTWASLSKAEGSMVIGGSDMVTVNFNSFGMTQGDVMTANVVFVTNDPENPEVVIPVTMHVGTEGVSENTEALSIYPNPATNNVTISGQNLDMVAIYNVAGQLVRTEKLNGMTTNIEMNVEAGVYFFNVVDNNGNSNIQRVVITK